MYDEILDEFLESKGVWTNIVPTNKDPEYSRLAHVVETYTKEGYSCMTNDHIRNQAYQSGILTVLSDFGPHTRKQIHVTEIGPGADACLIKMVQQAQKNIQYVGIEGNKKSAEKCTKLLKSLGFNNQEYKIIHSMSDNPSKELTSIYQHTDILLHELVGFIASREGLIRILADICKRNNNRLPRMIPSTIGTFFTPTYVDTTTFRTSVKSFVQGVMRIKDFPNIILMQPFCFHDIQTAPLWPSCGTLEFFDFSPSEEGDVSIEISEPVCNSSSFQIEQETKINSLTCFIHVGFEKQIRSARQSRTSFEERKFELNSQPDIGEKVKSTQCSFSTCSSLPPTSNGWPNTIFLFPEFVLLPGTIFHVTTSVDFRHDIPKYAFQIWSTKDKKIENQFSFDFY
jgi:hypothetical protein